MIQVGGFVHQLDVGKAEEKGDYRNLVFEAKGNKNGRKPTDNENKISPFTKRLHPFKSIIREDELRLYIQLLNPAIGRKTNDAYEHQNSEKYTENGQRSSICRTFKI